MCITYDFWKAIKKSCKRYWQKIKFVILSFYQNLRKEVYIINKEQSVQEWLPFEKILDDGIVVCKKQYVKIIKVIPINYDLKSNLEKESILNSYKLFLKTCDFDIQILIQSRKENLNSYISQINNQIEEEKNEKIEEISKAYIEYIQNQNRNKNSSSKNFYILINFKIENKNSEDNFNIRNVRENLNEKFFKIKDSLSRCGNLIFEIGSRKRSSRSNVFFL